MKSNRLIMLNDRFGGASNSTTGVFRSYTLATVIFEEAVKNNTRPEQQESIVAIASEGLSSFWYALSAMAAGQMVLPQVPDKAQQERRMRPYAKAMCRWWDEFCALEERYVGGLLFPLAWPGWFVGLNFFASYASLEELQRIARLDKKNIGIELSKLLPS